MTEPAKFEPRPDPEGLGSIEGFERIIGRLRDAHAEGTMTPQTVETLAAPRVMLDTEGHVWTVGLRSGEWYTFADGAWHEQASAPDADTLVRPERVRKGCHACGAVVDGEDPCPECGKAPAPVLEDQPDAVKQGLLAFLQEAPYPMVPEALSDDDAG